MEIVKRTDDTTGFVVAPGHRVVQHTFSWFGRNRLPVRNWKDLAETLRASAALVTIQPTVWRPDRR
ncbi:hypothetical protein [Prosthecodimorpha staleyi]|uniref:Uncharacterized protein n=1 Tax=Prosthecodimorpha staleyi TaxID=2840188 RepID=A0A947D7R1_9HYPH|nr:hypothetical protein [Prosthecodimorpha staleyi]MBT9288389.1 hypothetical protein [Prosthecodimorpha staleyi]